MSAMPGIFRNSYVNFPPTQPSHTVHLGAPDVCDAVLNSGAFKDVWARSKRKKLPLLLDLGYVGVQGKKNVNFPISLSESEMNSCILASITDLSRFYPFGMSFLICIPLFSLILERT